MVEQAKKRLEDGQRQKIIEEERKVRMLEQADTLLSDFNIKVAAAEEAAKMLSEKAEPLTVVDSVLELGDQVEESNQLVEEARKEVDERIKICHEYLQEYHLSMKVPDMPNHPQAAVVNSNLQKICERLRDATNNKDAIIVKCSNTHKKALKKKEAMAVMEEISAKFKQYDKNNDGFLSKAEVISYSNKEFGFKLGDAVALQLIKALQVGAKGVPFADFQRLKVRIGCLRERVKDEERKKKREIRDKELEHLKEQFKSELKSLDDTEELDQEVKKVEEAMGNIKVEATKAAELKSKYEEASGLLKGAEEALSELKTKVNELKNGVSADLKVWCLMESKSLDFKLQDFERRVTTLSRKQTQLENNTKAKEAMEAAMAEKKIVALLKHHQKAKTLTTEDLVKEMAKEEDQISKDAFVAFVGACEKDDGVEVTEEEIGTFFEAQDVEKEDFLTKEHMLMLVRTLKKVVKETTMTEGLDISESTVMTKLEVGEVVELLSEPSEQGDMLRARCRRMRDDTEGWVTIKGNQGSAYLADGGLVWRVLKETLLTESFDLDDDSASEEVRKLRLNELVEVREWMRKDEKSGMIRMKCKTKMDHKVGWATAVGNAGTVFLTVH